MDGDHGVARSGIVVLVAAAHEPVYRSLRLLTVRTLRALGHSSDVGRALGRRLRRAAAAGNRQDRVQPRAARRSQPPPWLWRPRSTLPLAAASIARKLPREEAGREPPDGESELYDIGPVEHAAGLGDGDGGDPHHQSEWRPPDISRLAGQANPKGSTFEEAESAAHERAMAATTGVAAAPVSVPIRTTVATTMPSRARSRTPRTRCSARHRSSTRPAGRRQWRPESFQRPAGSCPSQPPSGVSRKSVGIGERWASLARTQAEVTPQPMRGRGRRERRSEPTKCQRISYSGH